MISDNHNALTIASLWAPVVFVSVFAFIWLHLAKHEMWIVTIYMWSAITIFDLRHVHLSSEYC